jgi:hypothetical protein
MNKYIKLAACMLAIAAFAAVTVSIAMGCQGANC